MSDTLPCGHPAHRRYFGGCNDCDREVLVRLGWIDRERADAALGRLLLRVTDPRPEPSAPTPTEIRVLVCVSHGMTNEMVAETIGVGLESVKTHLRNVQRRLAAKNRAHAVAIALRAGIIT